MRDQKVAQTAAAERLNMSQAALSRRLLGRVEFRPSELEALAEMLGVPAEELMTGRSGQSEEAGA